MGLEGDRRIANKAAWTASAAFAGAILYQIACAPDALADNQTSAANPTDASISQQNSHAGNPLDQYKRGSTSGATIEQGNSAASSSAEAPLPPNNQSAKADTARSNTNQPGFFDLPVPPSQETSAPVSQATSESSTTSSSGSAQNTTKQDTKPTTSKPQPTAVSTETQKSDANGSAASAPSSSAPVTPAAPSSEKSTATSSSPSVGDKSPAPPSSGNNPHGGVPSSSKRKAPKSAPTDTGLFSLPVPGQKESASAPQTTAAPETQAAPAPNNRGFVFPLAGITKKMLKDQSPLKWCVQSPTPCHHDYPADDIFAPTGTQIVAPEAGVITNVQEPNSDPKNVTFGSNVEETLADGSVLFLDHMGYKTVDVHIGQHVNPGDPIGKVGISNDAGGTEPHLHIDRTLPGVGHRANCSAAACVSAGIVSVHGQLLQAFQALPDGNVPPAPAPSSVPGSAPATSASKSTESTPAPTSGKHSSSQADTINTGLFNLPVPGQSSTAEASPSNVDTYTGIFDLPVPSKDSPRPAPSSATTTPVQPAPQPPETAPAPSDVSKYMPLLDTISIGESHGNYDAYFRHGTNVNSPQLTAMSIAQVLAFQQQYVAKQEAAHEFASSAAGKYEMLEGTLTAEAQYLHIPLSTKFDAHTQDEIAVQLLKKRGLVEFEQGKITWQDFEHRLSEEWASLPDVEAPNPTESHYNQDGVNKAQISIDQIHQAIETIPHQ